MYKILLVAIVLFYCCQPGLAQKKWTKDWHLGVAYFGNNIWNPGLQITGQKLVFDRKIERTTRKDRIKIKYQQCFIDANLGFYYDNPSHWTIFNNFQFHYRRVRAKGKYRSVGLGPGYMRTFLPETYSVTNQGVVERVTRPGRWYLSPTLSFGTGRLWKRKGTGPWRLQISTFIITNYNAGPNALVNLEYGYLFGYKSKENVD